MNAQETTKLSGMLAMYAAYYRQTLPDAVLKMYAGDLSDLDFNRVSEALDAFRKNPKNRSMPLPAQIREMLEPQVDPDSAAREIAAAIQKAIVSAGWPNPERARAIIGEVGWTVIQRLGGWVYVSQGMGPIFDANTFQAQVRELVKSELIHDRDAMAKMIGLQIAPGNRPGELQSIGEIMKIGSGEQT